ncbi:MAG: hypothetical protein RLZ97_867 [Verrucomicrobiota bacterium]
MNSISKALMRLIPGRKNRKTDGWGQTKPSADFKSIATDKAHADDWLGRFREIIGDPVNILIDRVPEAGSVEGGCVTLHNGHRVALAGAASYYGRFSEILVLNRGVHEPLEEYVFQEVLKEIKEEQPTMLELGAYWAHYSMWMKKVRPGARTWMVEPEKANLDAGRLNFRNHGYSGDFIQAFVGPGQFSVSGFLEKERLDRLTLLHCDIQGYEDFLLEAEAASLAEHRFRYVFISTHSQEIHGSVTRRLLDAGYRVEVSSDFEIQTTSHDGFIFASSPEVPPVFGSMVPFDRPGRLPETGAAKLARLVSILEIRKGNAGRPD